jgi:hypothetical protein
MEDRPLARRGRPQFCLLRVLATGGTPVFRDRLNACPPQIPDLAQRHIILIEAQRRQIYADRTFRSLSRRS